MNNINTLISASQVIGQGLTQGACRIELRQAGGEGVFWQRRNAPSGAGIWCAKQDWQRWVRALTGIASAEDVASDVLPCLTAALLSAAACEASCDGLLDAVEQVPSIYGLVPDIYPVLTLEVDAQDQPSTGEFTGRRVEHFGCVLVDWPVKDWQGWVSQWSTFAGKSAQVSLGLVAGFVPQSRELAELPECGGGVWLDGDVQVEQGEALLWANGPLAKIRFTAPIEANTCQFDIISLLPNRTFIAPPLMVELGRVTVSLAKVGAMMAADKMTGEVSLHSQVRLTRMDPASTGATLATVGLLRSEQGLLAQVKAFL